LQTCAIAMAKKYQEFNNCPLMRHTVGSSCLLSISWY